jgi:enoyl-CoA hydratase/carnithine racemase
MSEPARPTALADGKLLLDEPAADIVRLTIANPAKRNALDHPILDAIAAVLGRIEARCVIVTGSQGMFSAGYDIGEIPDAEFRERAEQLVAHPFTEAIDALEAYPYPTLAAIGGHAIGGGLELALACDLRVCAAGVELGMPPARLGLVYSHTGLRRFIDAVGVVRTRELFLLGRYVDAARAADWGLVNRTVDADELASAALETAVQLATGAPLAQRGNKKVIRALLDAHGEIDPELERELIELREASFASHDLREGVRAFAEKRPPHWRGE